MTNDKEGAGTAIKKQTQTLLKQNTNIKNINDEVASVSFQ
jgi:hypothetical protein